jgi:hypothetical protein
MRYMYKHNKEKSTTFTLSVRKISRPYSINHTSLLILVYHLGLAYRTQLLHLQRLLVLRPQLLRLAIFDLSRRQRDLTHVFPFQGVPPRALQYFLLTLFCNTLPASI